MTSSDDQRVERGRALLVAGTSSDAGKSTLVAGLCRWLHQRGVRVAPFKAMNMSNNSSVAVGPSGAGEIGRAQALQAAACGLEPSVRFNPVLLKPGADNSSQVIVRGQVVGAPAQARDYRHLHAELVRAVDEAFSELQAEFEVVIAEGAGSLAEINLRDTDLANLGLAARHRVPTIVIGDIERGGFFAAAYGSLALLSPDDQALVHGYVVNRFRGDAALLQPGLIQLQELTGRPILGVLPWLPDLGLDLEDSLSYRNGMLAGGGPPCGSQVLRVAVVRLPRAANLTDVDPLAIEPGVVVRLTTSVPDIQDADLVILPGSKSTVDDLAWLRRTGLADAVLTHAAQGRPVFGICGGYQMLAHEIIDDVESRAGRVKGLGLLPITVRFAAAKTVRRSTGVGLGVPVAGYEIHYGVAQVSAKPLLTYADGTPEGARADGACGTHWHGVFDSDDFRRKFLAEAASVAGRRFVPASDTDFAATRERMLDRLAEMVGTHLNTDAIERLLSDGPAEILWDRGA